VYRAAARDHKLARPSTQAAGVEICVTDLAMLLDGVGAKSVKHQE
jgi:hypothetical protein